MMEELYGIMNECLKNRYSVNAFITILENLEASYTEEEQPELKSMAYVSKVYLKELQEDMTNTINKIDRYIVAEAGNRKR